MLLRPKTLKRTCLPQLGEVFLPGACKNYIFGDPLTLFDSELCDEQLHRRPAGDRGRAWPINIGYQADRCDFAR